MGAPKSGRTKRATPEEIDTILALYRAGASCRAIGKAVGRSGMHVSNVLRKAGAAIPPKARLPERPQQLLDEATQLRRNEGLTCREIALRLSVSEGYLSWVLYSNGISLKAIRKIPHSGEDKSPAEVKDADRACRAETLRQIAEYDRQRARRLAEA